MAVKSRHIQNYTTKSRQRKRLVVFYWRTVRAGSTSGLIGIAGRRRAEDPHAQSSLRQVSINRPQIEIDGRRATIAKRIGTAH